uniref:Uncharacterized protein n=1 Tax=Tanacetum cinerariifolium TaxID=118510 RepID=A0A6L2LD50_TANCI|nr:hypothetical protein [Tanacetum cinerariifolium]
MSDLCQSPSHRACLWEAIGVAKYLLASHDESDWVTKHHNKWEPKHPQDVDLESKNTEIFSMTYELTHLPMHYPISFMLHLSIIEGFINRLWKIGNLISKAFWVFCIPEEYSPHVFRFMETYRKPTLMELYEVMCKAEDDLWIISREITNKHSAKDKEDDL